MQLHNDFLRGWEGKQYDTKLGLKIGDHARSLRQQSALSCSLREAAEAGDTRISRNAKLSFVLALRRWIVPDPSPEAAGPPFKTRTANTPPVVRQRLFIAHSEAVR
jgi:hypothetical protein